MLAISKTAFFFYAIFVHWGFYKLYTNRIIKNKMVIWYHSYVTNLLKPVFCEQCQAIILRQNIEVCLWHFLIGYGDFHSLTCAGVLYFIRWKVINIIDNPNVLICDSAIPYNLNCSIKKTYCIIALPVYFKTNSIFIFFMDVILKCLK